MKKINLLYQFTDQTIEDILNEGNRSSLILLETSFKDRFEEYRTTHGSPESITNTPSDFIEQKTKLIGMYKSGLNTCGEIKDKIYFNGLLTCPYCGNIGTPDTIDHYLPKADYPEFSIFSDNLVPSCFHCNNNRKDRPNTKETLHPYFDQVMNQALVEMKISQPFNEYNICITPFTSLPVAVNKLVSKHITNLKMNKTARTYCKGQYNRFSSRYRRENLSLLDMQNIFESDKKNSLTVGGVNSYDHLFYSEVLSKPNLLKFICEDFSPTTLGEY